MMACLTQCHQRLSDLSPQAPEQDGVPIVDQLTQVDKPLAFWGELPPPVPSFAAGSIYTCRSQLVRLTDEHDDQ